MNRIVVSNATPNNKGFVIPNEALDFSRFKSNPVILAQHDWESEPIGLWTNWKIEGDSWTAEPVFHGLTAKSIEYKALYEGGWIKAASIGGFIVGAKDKIGNDALDGKGNKVADKFYVYEISLVTLPSNPDALQLNSVELYEEKQFEQLLTLSAKFMAKKEEQKDDVQKPEAEKVEVKEEQKSEESPKVTHVILEAFTAMKEWFTATAKVEADKPAHSEPDGDEPVKSENVELCEKQEAEKAEKVEKNEDADAKKDEEKATEKVEAKTDVPVIDEILKDINNSKKPKMKDEKELAAEGVKLAAAPEKTDIKFTGNDMTFSKLSADKDGQRIIERIKDGNGQVSDYRVQLNALINEPRFKVVMEKMRFHTGLTSEQQIEGLRGMSNISANRENDPASLTAMAARMDRMVLDSAALITTPDTAAIEFSPLFLNKLFPSDAWKTDISLFPVEQTAKNIGIIFTNIAADPAVYKGTLTTRTPYTYSDTAVSLAMSTYALQPMSWTPLTMHTLRYDQMATGWAQGLVKFGTVIDDELIYTLSAQIIALSPTSLVTTDGGSFSIDAAANAINAFYASWSTFTGSLAKPSLNDVLKLEQMYKKQNLDPSAEKAVLVMDATADRYITADPETKSLLTRFVNSAGSDLVGYKNTKFVTRSRVGVYDTSTSLPKDPDGLVASTYVGANLSFIPSQVGIGIGTFDVFMVQNPLTYSYTMSADIRMGATLLRQGGQGAAVYTYGAPTA